MTAERLIQLLKLTPHPKEGGFFRETYRSSTTFEPGAPFAGTRSHGTAIYYLLTWDTYSEMHCLPGDELFHFYLGDPVEMLMLHPTGKGEIVVLGQDLTAGMKLSSTSCLAGPGKARGSQRAVRGQSSERPWHQDSTTLTTSSDPPKCSTRIQLTVP